MTKPRRTFILGLDGLTFTVLDPYRAAGHMPNFDALQTIGVRGELLSTAHPGTPQAWMTIATGLSPTQHGVLDFTVLDRASRRLRSVTKRQAGRAIWQLLGQAGMRSLIVNVPFTYPTDAVHGTMISGIPCVLDDLAFFPRGSRLPFLERFPGYAVDALFEHDWLDGCEDRAFQATLRNTRRQLNVLDFSLQNADWDFVFLVLGGPDRIQHGLWDEIASFDARAVQCFRLFDEVLGRALRWAGDDGVVAVVSDHGFEKRSGLFFANEVLRDAGLLCVRTSAIYRALARDVAKRVWNPLSARLGLRGALDSADILRSVKAKTADWQGAVGLADWEKSVAIATSTASIYLLQRTVGGWKRVVEALEGTGLVRVGTPEEFYGPGPYTQGGPDLVYHVTSAKIASPAFRNFGSSKERRNTADHNPRGVLYLSGPGIRHGSEIEGATVLDIVPTVLHMMGLPVDNRLRGTVLEQAFEEPQQVKSLDPRTGAVYVQRHETAGALSALDKLRGS